MTLLSFLVAHWFLTALVALVLILVIPSIRIVGPTELGLVTKRFAFKALPEDNPIAFQSEAGYQADLLMPGWHFKLWLVYLVEKHPWVQVRAGEIGVVVAQVGKSLPVHPVGFLVITRERVYGVPVAHEFQRLQALGKLSFQSFGLSEEQLKVTVITPRTAAGGFVVDTCGIVTTLEGPPLPGGAIASRPPYNQERVKDGVSAIPRGDARLASHSQPAERPRRFRPSRPTRRRFA